MNTAPYNPFSLQGKRVLVTGASSGIGRRIAIECSRMGAGVVATGRDTQRLRETLDTLAPGEHASVAADVTVPDERERLVDECGPIDGVVHCAGTSILSPIRMATEQHLRGLYTLNYESPMMLTQRLLQKKSIRNNGAILFMSSIAAHWGQRGVGVYSGTKAALIGTARCLALEVVKQKIRVNCLSPALVATPLLDRTGMHVSLDELQNDYPLGFGMPEDVAYAAVYFLSDASRWVTGTTLIMDGGLSIC